MGQPLGQFPMGNSDGICSFTDCVSTNRTEKKGSVDPYLRGIFVQCDMRRHVFHWNSATTGKCIQYALFYSHIRHTDG